MRSVRDLSWFGLLLLLVAAAVLAGSIMVALEALVGSIALSPVGVAVSVPPLVGFWLLLATTSLVPATFGTLLLTAH